MKTFMKFFFAFIMLCVFKPAMGAPLYQDMAASGPFAEPARDTVFTIPRDTSFNHIDTKLKIAAARLRLKVAMARQYCIANKFNTSIVFMVDMSIPSGKNRFFVYNLDNDSIEFTALVSHGSGSYKPNCDDQLVFSNLPNSNATSLGRYKIGDSYHGTYGLSYKLYGLDSTNNMAFQRSIVLHADNYVPNKETYPYHIFESSGCPTVSPSFLTVLGKYMAKSKKPMLLWVYN
jgi:hypothetical protein